MVRQQEITLGNLPHDVIRRIARESDLPEHCLRLISRRWNSVVLEPQLIPVPIVSVHFDPVTKGEVKVRVLLGPGHGFRYCTLFRGWNDNKQGDRIESPPLRLISKESLLPWMRCFRPLVTVDFVRLFTVFSRCPLLGTLFLHNINRRLLTIVLKVVGEVSINQLIIYDDVLDENLTKAIAKFVHDHKTEKVTICTKKITSLKLDKFFANVISIAKEVLIYESIESSEMIFGQRREIWEKKAEEMSKGGGFLVEVMKGAKLWAEGSHLFRLKICAR